MTNHVARLYLLALALLLFFALWAGIATHPWATAALDPRTAALDRREAALWAEAARTQSVLAERWAAYRAAVRERNALLASLGRQRTQQAAVPPAVRVTTLPPVTTTRSS